MRCRIAQWAALLRDLAAFNELEWLALRFNELVVWAGCEALED